MSDCTKAIRAAVGDEVISEAEATNLLQRMKNLAESRAAKRGVKISEAIKDIAGELRAGDDALRLIDKRNRLLSIAATKTQVEKITGAGKLFGKAFKDALLSTDAEVRALERRGLSAMNAKLEELGLMREWRSQKYSKEAYLEMHNVERGGTTPVVEGEIGKKLHELMKFHSEQRKMRNAMLNRVGAYFPDREDYGFSQTHSRDRLWQMAGRIDEGHKARARTAFFDLVASVNVDPRTYAGRDPSLFWSNFFENVYNGKHVQGVTEGIDIDRFEGIHGSLANRLSQGRLLWFADAESQWQWNQTLGTKGWAESMQSEVSNWARSYVLMREWGPNWENNLKLVGSKLQDLASDRTDSAKHTKSLEGFNSNAYLDLLSGAANVSKRPTLSKVVRDAVAFIHLTKMGGAVLASFPDAVMVNNTLAMNGLSHLEALGAQLDLSKVSREHLVGMNVLSNGFLGSLHNRFGVGESSGMLARGAHYLFQANFFNRWNDMNQEVTAKTLSWWLGKHSEHAFADLPEGLRLQLSKADIRASDWDAIRFTAKDVKADAGELASEGKRFVLLDQLAGVPDSHVDAVIRERGLTVSPANRRRIRDDLDMRLSTYFSQQVDNALNTPDLETKYYTSGGGAQAGTFPRVIWDLGMVFKSFPISAFLRMKRRAEDAGVSWASFRAGEWNKKQYSFIFQQAQLVAMSAVAGYVAMTTRDLLNGRTRRQLIGEDGTPNVPVFIDALAKGGGLGIMGDFLFSEYDRQYKSALNAFAGPVFGMADQLGSIYTGARKSALGDETATRPLSELANLASSNIPFANLFYVKPLLNALVFYNLREMLSPGVLKRAERSAREQNYQDFWIEPSALAEIPITEPGRKLQAIIE